MSRTDWTDADIDRHFADLDPAADFGAEDDFIVDTSDDAQLADDADMADAQWGSRFVGWGIQAAATEG
jgi:hypothetical protein